MTKLEQTQHALEQALDVIANRCIVEGEHFNDAKHTKLGRELLRMFKDGQLEQLTVTLTVMADSFNDAPTKH